MTERTFRTPSPSPSRQASRTEPIVHPPVPALPQDYANSPTTAAKSKSPSSALLVRTRILRDYPLQEQLDRTINVKLLIPIIPSHSSNNHLSYNADLICLSQMTSNVQTAEILSTSLDRCRRDLNLRFHSRLSLIPPCSPMAIAFRQTL